jgi:hypothetical protein
MNRRNLILTLAAAALLPSTVLFAAPGLCAPSQSSCDKKLEATIINLEKYNWEIGRTQNLPAAKKFLSDFCFEILNDGTLLSKDDVLGGVVGDFSMTPVEFSDFHVVRLNEATVVVHYRIVVEFIVSGAPEISGSYELRATSTYSLIKGCWKYRWYQESLMAFTPLGNN